MTAPTMLHRIHLEAVDTYASRRQLYWTGLWLKQQSFSYSLLRNLMGALRVKSDKTKMNLARHCNIPQGSWIHLAGDRILRRRVTSYNIANTCTRIYKLPLCDSGLDHCLLV